MKDQKKIRLSKLMSEKGLCSRREADRYIQDGQVLVNKEIVDVLGTKISLDADIRLTDRASFQQKKKVTILLNKPIGYVSTQPEKCYIPAIDLICKKTQYQTGSKPFQKHYLKNLHVAGRLDIDSKGLLILTQDGCIVKKIIGPTSKMEKEYIVGIEGEITNFVLEKLKFGLSLDNKKLKRAVVKLIKPNLLRFVLMEGKKRQIRRMCELVNLKVIKIKRVRVGNVLLGNLPEGKWRFLKSHEKF